MLSKLACFANVGWTTSSQIKKDIQDRFDQAFPDKDTAVRMGELRVSVYSNTTIIPKLDAFIALMKKCDYQAYDWSVFQAGVLQYYTRLGTLCDLDYGLYGLDIPYLQGEFEMNASDWIQNFCLEDGEKE